MIVFVSYSQKDRYFVRTLLNDLQNQNIEVWQDEKSINIGDSITDEIPKGIEKADYFLIVISSNSINSKWVNTELSVASFLQRKLKPSNFIIPILLEKCEIPELLISIKYVDFTQDHNSGLKKLLKTVNLIKRDQDNLEVIGKPVMDTDILRNIFSFNKEISCTNDINKLLETLKINGCLREGYFKLVSGKVSKYYIMPINLYNNEESSKYFTNLLITYINKLNINFDTIICPSLTNGVIIAYHLFNSSKDKIYNPLDISSNKRSITLRKVDLVKLKNSKCLFVDDVITSGDSIRTVTKIFSNYDLNISSVITLFHRNKQNYNKLKNELDSQNIQLISPIFVDLDNYTFDEKNLLNVDEIN